MFAFHSLPRPLPARLAPPPIPASQSRPSSVTAMTTILARMAGVTDVTATTTILARMAGVPLVTAMTAIADRLVGVPPMHYLATWRMHVATQQLRNTSASLAQVAKMVGYDSEAAFSRAFKKAFGVAPATWRRSNS